MACCSFFDSMVATAPVLGCVPASLSTYLLGSSRPLTLPPHTHAPTLHNNTLSSPSRTSLSRFCHGRTSSLLPPSLTLCHSIPPTPSQWPRREQQGPPPRWFRNWRQSGRASRRLY